MSYLTHKCNVIVNDSLRTLVSDADYAAVKLYIGYSDGLLKFAYACSVIFMIIGIPGNIITIAALAYYRKVRNATAIFIMNMSCTDLLLLCMGPPVAISNFKNRSWMHGKVFCQLYPLAKYTLISASILTTMAVTINRYILIIHPRLYRKIYRKRNMALMLAAIWIFPLTILIPTYLGTWGCFDLDPEDGSCSVIADQYKRSPKKFLFIVALGLPCIPIIFCYTRIFFRVLKASKKSQITKSPIQARSSSAEETTLHACPAINGRYISVTIGNRENIKENIPLSFIKNIKTEESNITILETSNEGKNNTSQKKLLPPSTIRRNILQRSMTLLSRPTRKDKRLGTMILAIMTSFCLCYLPTVITEMLRGITSNPQLNITAHILLYFSSCFNPIIYVVMSKEYQKAYMNLLKCIYIKKSFVNFCGRNRDN